MSHDIMISWLLWGLISVWVSTPENNKDNQMRGLKANFQQSKCKYEVWSALFSVQSSWFVYCLSPLFIYEVRYGLSQSFASNSYGIVLFDS